MDSGTDTHSGDVTQALARHPAPALLVSADGHVIFRNAASNGLGLLGSVADLLPQMLLAAGFQRGVPVRLADHADARVFAAQLHAQLVALIDLDGSHDWRQDLEAMRQSALAEPRILTQDDLTGAGNALGLANAAAREITRSERISSPTSLLLVNLAKPAQPHDEELRNFVKCLHTAIRPTDAVFRLDQACCAVLAPDLSWHQAHLVAERIVDALLHYPFDTDIAVRVGAAERLIGEHVDAWLDRAQDALRQASEATATPIVVLEDGASETWTANARASALRLVWDDSYRSGHAITDSGHQLLFSKANDVLGMATRQGVNSSRVRQLVDELIDVIESHCQAEEELLRGAGYRSLELYRSEHRQMLLDARQMRDRVRTGNVEVTQLIDFLAVGVINRHILGVGADAHRAIGRWYTQEILKPVRAVSESARKRGLRPSDAVALESHTSIDGTLPPLRP